MLSCDIYMKAHVQIAKHFSQEASDLVGSVQVPDMEYGRRTYII